MCRRATRRAAIGDERWKRADDQLAAAHFARSLGQNHLVRAPKLLRAGSTTSLSAGWLGGSGRASRTRVGSFFRALKVLHKQVEGWCASQTTDHAPVTLQ
jgi:hypothetical protein